VQLLQFASDVFSKSAYENYVSPPARRCWQCAPVASQFGCPLDELNVADSIYLGGGTPRFSMPSSYSASSLPSADFGRRRRNHRGRKRRCGVTARHRESRECLAEIDGVGNVNSSSDSRTATQTGAHCQHLRAGGNIIFVRGLREHIGSEVQ